MIGTMWLIVFAVLLVMIAMCLAAIEQALTRVSNARVNELRDARVHGADRLAAVLANRARCVSSLLLVRIACEVFAIILVTVACWRGSPSPQWLALVIAGAIMVPVSYVVIGVGPRTLGQQHAVPFALRGAGLARTLATVVGPLTRVLILLGNAITPGKGYRQGPFATQAELREMVDLAEADHLIEEGERRMIHSVFELGDTIAREVMVPRTEMVWIERNQSVHQALSMALRSGFSRIPVIGDNLDDVLGMAYLKDLSRRSFEQHDGVLSEKVEGLMRPVALVPESKPADELLREMQANRVHVAIVIDEYGGTAGLITIEDIVEEIVGEIADEYDEQEIPEMQELPDGCWRVSARMQLDDFAQLVDLKVRENVEGVETVAGLLGRRLGVVPIPGSSIEVEGYELIAELAEGRRNRVGSILVRPLPELAKDATDPNKETEKSNDD